MATTGTDGGFTISDIPAGSGYTILVIKGAYMDRWTGSPVSVSEGETTNLDPAVFGITSPELGNGGGIVWKGELDSEPENPQINWVYYNKGNGTSYIYTEADWDNPGCSGQGWCCRHGGRTYYHR